MGQSNVRRSPTRLTDASTTTQALRACNGAINDLKPGTLIAVEEGMRLFSTRECSVTQEYKDLDESIAVVLASFVDPTTVHGSEVHVMVLVNGQIGWFWDFTDSLYRIRVLAR